jgi:O-glycosyl hydrolase
LSGKRCRTLRAATLVAAAIVSLAIALPASGWGRQRPRGRIGGAVVVVQTSADLKQALTRLADPRFTSTRTGGIPVIHVDDSRTYQRVTGFGGTMTDSAAWLLGTKLGARLQRLRRGATVCRAMAPARIHVHACSGGNRHVYLERRAPAALT